jgi:hypothetical protein
MFMYWQRPWRFLFRSLYPGVCSHHSLMLETLQTRRPTGETNYLTTYLNCNLTDFIIDMSICFALKYVEA